MDQKVKETRQLRQLEEEEKRIETNISKIKNRIAVFSGKGGVGKTTVSVNLAYNFQLKGFTTGLLDADITGPNVAKMMGIDDDVTVTNDKIYPYQKYGLKMISIAGLIKHGQPVIWRGPMRSKLINQFLADVEWNELDYLIADLPPGTGDEILTIVQKMKPQFAVIVTTPQEVALLDAERAINMAKKLEIPAIGVVENMSSFTCPSCGNNIDLFGSGGGKKLAENNDIKFLGSIPVDIETRILGDNGVPVVLAKKDSEISNAFNFISTSIQNLKVITEPVLQN